MVVTAHNPTHVVTFLNSPQYAPLVCGQIGARMSFSQAELVSVEDDLTSHSLALCVDFVIFLCFGVYLLHNSGD
jgi:hypothetical protein